MAAGTLNPLNMQNWILEATPHRPDGAIEALTVGFDSIGGMNCVFAIKWAWDVCFSIVFGFELVDFEDQAVNDIIGSANGGAGMWDQASGPGLPTWREFQNGASYTPAAGGDPVSGQLAVNARFSDVVSTFSVHDAEVATDGGEFHGIVIAAMQYYHDNYVTPAVDPGPPPGRVPPEVQWPPIKAGLITNGEAVIAAQCSRLTLVGGVVGAIPIP